MRTSEFIENLLALRGTRQPTDRDIGDREIVIVTNNSEHGVYGLEMSDDGKEVWIVADD